MSRPLMSLAVACGLLAAAGSAGAQGLPEARAEMERQAARIDSLLPDVARQWHAWVLADSAAKLAALRIEQQLDTVWMGPLMAVGTEGTMRLVRSSLLAVWADQAPLFGESARVLEGRMLVLPYGASNRHLSDLAMRANATRLDVIPLSTPRTRQRAIEWAMSQEFVRALPPEIVGWLSGAYVPSQAPASDIHRELVLSPDPASRACLRGDVAACGDILGLSESLQDTVPTRVNAVVRAHFFTNLLREHAGTLDRLRAAPGETAGERLAAATGVPLDGLLQAWQRRVVTATATRDEEDNRSRAASLVWIALFATLATRSTRWRFG